MLGVTFDGASVNRRLVKLHDTSQKTLYSVCNVHAPDGRQLFFFSDPPHLIKTTRNCWASKGRILWVSIIIVFIITFYLVLSYLQNDGDYIKWQHLVDLYDGDKGNATGLCVCVRVCMCLCVCVCV